MNVRMFTPTRESLLSNLRGCILPLFLGVPMLAAALFLPYGTSTARWFMGIMGGLGIVVALYTLRATIAVHQISMGVSDQGLHFARGGRGVCIPWKDIQFGRLHVRPDPKGRTDRMLVISMNQRLLQYYPSVLSEADEAEFLRLVRARLRLEEVKVKPS